MDKKVKYDKDKLSHPLLRTPAFWEIPSFAVLDPTSSHSTTLSNKIIYVYFIAYL